MIKEKTFYPLCCNKLIIPLFLKLGKSCHMTQNEITLLLSAISK